MIQISCSCGRSYRPRDELAGKKFLCKQCQQVVEVNVAAPVSVLPTAVRLNQPATPVAPPVVARAIPVVATANPIVATAAPIVATELPAAEADNPSDAKPVKKKRKKKKRRNQDDDNPFLDQHGAA